MATSGVVDLLIGTGNAGKIRELKTGLRGLPIALRVVSEILRLPPPPETGFSYEENALVKANFYYQITGLWTLADDSGLEVDGLQGQPGLHTARYGGTALTDEERLAYVLKKLSNANNRAARFVCVLALVGPQYSATVRGDCYGSITPKPRGRRGFGYDPIFVPDGYKQTFAELTDLTKSQISHRARALSAAKPLLQRIAETRQHNSAV
jgi:XTP/dITP diphosphohydrolase